MQSILVPIAPEGLCSHLRRAVWLARRSGAGIIVLCVSPHDRDAAEGEHERARLEAVLDAPDIPVKWLNIRGSAADEILRATPKERADLIVMAPDPKWHMESGWSQDRAFQRFLLGSTVAKVVQDARCPVWLDRSSPSSGMDLTQIICCLDLERNCERLIKFASRIAGEWQMQLVLFHSTVRARIFAPGQPRHVAELQRYHVETAESKIDQLQSRCSTSAPRIVAIGDDAESLCHTLKDFSAPLVVLDRVSDRWGDNHKIFQIIRRCQTSVLINVEAKQDQASVMGPRKGIDPFFLLLAAIGIGVSLIYLAMYLATHTDQCHFAAIRCQTPAGVLFPANGRPATPP